jgi:signal transduction histidine kinase
MGAGRDLFARRKDGSQFSVEIGLRPFQGPDGLFVISSIVDITERLKDRERLMNRNDELQQFAYRTSHDLKAPLISMKGLAEFIIEDAENGDLKEVVLNAEKITHLSDRLKTLLEDILELTKADYRNEPSVDILLNDVMDNVRLKFEVMAGKQNVEIKEFFAHNKPLNSQATLITQILDNLISNAIKYSDAKKDSSYVCIRTFSDANRFYIQVEDNGLGIPTVKQPEVFGMFKRFHQENTEGSGLGLYLVKKHIFRLQGQISFESSEKGTTFFISLPNPGSANVPRSNSFEIF